MRSLIGFIVAIGVVLVAIAGIAYFALQSGTEETTAPDIHSGESTGEPNYVITPVPLTDDIRDVMPSLKRQVQFSASVPENVREPIRAKVASFQAMLDTDPTNGGAWLDLALWYHTANDYEGAVEVCEFLTKAIPTDSTAFNNLGKLYHFSLKDFPKSESYFKEALRINAEDITPYLELHTLYAYSYKKESTSAVDILEEAFRAFPNNPDPLTMLGSYWREKGNVAKAREAYTRALEVARALNNVALIQNIGNELSNLPQ